METLPLRMQRHCKMLEGSWFFQKMIKLKRSSIQVWVVFTKRERKIYETGKGLLGFELKRGSAGKKFIDSLNSISCSKYWRRQVIGYSSSIYNSLTVINEKIHPELHQVMSVINWDWAYWWYSPDPQQALEKLNVFFNVKDSPIIEVGD